MSATLRRAHQIYFSNIAIFVGQHPMFFPPSPGRNSTLFLKKRAKGTQTAETAFQTDSGHRNCCFFEEKFRPFQSAMIQVLVRRLTERAPENSKQMKRRQTRRGGDLEQWNRSGQMRVQLVPGPIHSSPQFLSG